MLHGKVDMGTLADEVLIHLDSAGVRGDDPLPPAVALRPDGGTVMPFVWATGGS